MIKRIKRWKNEERMNEWKNEVLNEWQKERNEGKIKEEKWKKVEKWLNEWRKNEFMIEDQILCQRMIEWKNNNCKNKWKRENKNKE